MQKIEVIGLLNTFDESIETLELLLTPKFIKQFKVIIALDGPYRLYKDANKLEYTKTPDEVLEWLRKRNILVISTGQVWETELEKRQALFSYGYGLGKLTDYLMVIDSDEQYLDGIIIPKENKYKRLSVYMEPENKHFPKLFLNEAPIELEHNHFTYKYKGDKKYLWGYENQKLHPMAQSGIICTHTDNRTNHRYYAKHRYYNLRDDIGLEADPCFYHRDRRPYSKYCVEWTRKTNGKFGYKNVFLCEECTEKHQKINQIKWEKWGIKTGMRPQIFNNQKKLD